MSEKSSPRPHLKEHVLSNTKPFSHPTNGIDTTTPVVDTDHSSRQHMGIEMTKSIVRYIRTLKTVSKGDMASLISLCIDSGLVFEYTGTQLLVGESTSKIRGNIECIVINVEGE